MAAADVMAGQSEPATTAIYTSTARKQTPLSLYKPSGKVQCSSKHTGFTRERVDGAHSCNLISPSNLAVLALRLRPAFDRVTFKLPLSLKRRSTDANVVWLLSVWKSIPVHSLNFSSISFRRTVDEKHVCQFRPRKAFHFVDTTCTLTNRYRHDGNTARLARRGDEALGVLITVARIAPSTLDAQVHSPLNIEVFRADEREARMEQRHYTRPPRKPADLFHRQARFPHAKIRPKWEASSLTTPPRPPEVGVTSSHIPTKANMVLFPTESPPDFRMCNRTVQCRWLAGFLGDLPFPPPLHSGGAPFLPRFIIIGSQDLDVKRRPKLFTYSLGGTSRTHRCFNSRNPRVSTLRDCKKATPRPLRKWKTVQGLERGVCLTTSVPPRRPPTSDNSAVCEEDPPSARIETKRNESCLRLQSSTARLIEGHRNQDEDLTRNRTQVISDASPNIYQYATTLGWGRVVERSGCPGNPLGHGAQLPAVVFQASAASPKGRLATGENSPLSRTTARQPALHELSRSNREEPELRAVHASKMASPASNIRSCVLPNQQSSYHAVANPTQVANNKQITVGQLLAHELHVRPHDCVFLCGTQQGHANNSYRPVASSFTSPSPNQLLFTPFLNLPTPLTDINTSLNTFHSLRDLTSMACPSSSVLLHIL
ncbi:hypothetical protein PR048_018691 [Dryococelus australis]|uniref:Uncharacterized protein n=1 Tax=Dryococelus australis TaxID=614101 RepID=A0ABQ9HDR7_9NEOP|nr:hypothetical protein PR048_018691 [Dryococelus australis]